MENLTSLMFGPIGHWLAGWHLRFFSLTLILLGVLWASVIFCKVLRRDADYARIRRLAMFACSAALLIVAISLPGLAGIVVFKSESLIFFHSTYLGFLAYAGGMLAITLPFVFGKPVQVAMENLPSPMRTTFAKLGFVLLGVAAIALPMAAFASSYPYHREQVAMQQERAAFKKLWSDVGANAVTRDGSPRSAVYGVDFEKLIGDRLKPLDALQDVEGLEFEGTDLQDSDLVHLTHLSKLKSLNFQNTKISDQGLAQLEHLTNLESLDLARTSITDEGLKHIQGMRKLQVLNIEKTHVTDASAGLLLGLPGLTRVDLRGTTVADATKSALRKKTGVQVIDD